MARVKHLLCNNHPNSEILLISHNISRNFTHLLAFLFYHALSYRAGPSLCFQPAGDSNAALRARRTRHSPGLLVTLGALLKCPGPQFPHLETRILTADSQG